MCRQGQPANFQQNKVTPPKRKIAFGFLVASGRKSAAFRPPTATPSPQWEAPLPALVCLRCSTPACQFWPVGVNKRGEARWVRRGFSPSRPPPGERGEGGWLTKKILPPQTPPPFQAHAPWSAMFPHPFAAGVASLRGGWGLVSAIFHIHEHVQWFPRCGLRWPRATGAPGPAVPARGCGGLRFRKTKVGRPSTLPEKDQFFGRRVGGN